jgi:uncharacterized PurR-regulated membrane protein YhhQ (DUF165 family)
MIYVALYLFAIIAANLIVTRFGPSASIITAFVLIGLDLTARDHLHDAWHGKHLARNMTLLIAAGSALTIIINRDAGRIAVASFAAFTVAATVDTITYHRLYDRTRLVRVNGSNVFGAAADSLLFPLLAFGWPPLVGVMLGQFAAKVGGGFVWSVLLGAFKWDKAT